MLLVRTLTFRILRSTVYVALPVPEQLPYSGYATVQQSTLNILSYSFNVSVMLVLWLGTYLMSKYESRK